MKFVQYIIAFQIVTNFVSNDSQWIMQFLSPIKFLIMFYLAPKPMLHFVFVIVVVVTSEIRLQTTSFPDPLN